MSDFDVLIIGGGPTGLSASITTANRGLSTLLVEEHPEIGKPLACGEGISANKLVTVENMPNPNEELNNGPLSLQHNQSFIEREIQYQRFFFGSKGVATAQLHALTINRTLFDKSMAIKAKSNGVEFLLDAQVIKIQRKGLGLQVTTTKGDFNANIVIGCDGPSAHSVRMMNLRPPSKYVQGFEYKFHGVHTDALDFYFDFENIHHMHYGWVFPKKSDTNVGVVTDIASNPKQILEKFINSLHNKNLKESNIIQKIAGIIPASGPISKTYADNFLVAGDAAGLTNSIFYGGIAVGVHSGFLAAETAWEAYEKNRFDEQQMSIYQKKLHTKPYSDPIIQKAHDVLYSELTGKDLNTIGSWIDGWDITTLSQFQKLKLFVKVLKKPSMIKKFKSGKILAYGFSKSRDWGF